MTGGEIRISGARADEEERRPKQGGWADLNGAGRRALIGKKKKLALESATMPATPSRARLRGRRKNVSPGAKKIPFRDRTLLSSS